MTTGLALLVTGVSARFSDAPRWLWFKVSAAGFGMALVLALVFLGKELHWWHIDGEALDYLAYVWIVLTTVAMAATYWIAR